MNKVVVIQDLDKQITVGQNRVVVVKDLGSVSKVEQGRVIKVEDIQKSISVDGQHVICIQDNRQVVQPQAGVIKIVTSFAKGDPGTNGQDGLPGAPGADGKTVLNGAGVPDPGLGVDGDFYFNTITSAIYGPKTAGSWGAGTSIVGPQGEAGATLNWINGDWDPGVTYHVNDALNMPWDGTYRCIQEISGFDGYPYPGSEYWVPVALNGSNGADGLSGLDEPGLRLTLSSSLPVNPADGLSSYVYCLPYHSGMALIWDGSTWQSRSVDSAFTYLNGMGMQADAEADSPILTNWGGFGNVSLGMAVSGTGIPLGTTVLSQNDEYHITLSANCTVTGTVWPTFIGLPNTVYDIFLHWNNQPFLKAIPWASATARATPLGVRDGFLVYAAQNKWLYLGTCVTNASRQVVDSSASRGLWNMFNRVPRKLKVLDSAAADTYNGDWRPLKNNYTLRVGVVVGIADTEVDLTAMADITYATAPGGYIGIGYDRIDGDDSDLSSPGGGLSASPVSARLVHQPTIGTHYYQILEKSISVNNQVFGSYPSGMTGWILG